MKLSTQITALPSRLALEKALLKFDLNRQLRLQTRLQVRQQIGEQIELDTTFFRLSQVWKDINYVASK